MGNLGSCCRLCLLSTDDQRIDVQKDEIFKKQFAKIFQYEVYIEHIENKNRYIL